MDRHMGRIFYVMGKSASGKDTIYNRLMAEEEIRFQTMVGYTTRPMREQETEGREYHFIKGTGGIGTPGESSGKTGI